MPKMKTHRGAAKRFKVTGTGKIRRRKAFRDHLLENEVEPAHAPARPRRRGDRRRQEARRAHARRSSRQPDPPTGGRRTVTRGVMARSSVPSRARSTAARSSRRPQGYTGSRSRNFRKANEQVMHSLRYAVPRPAGAQGRVPPALDRAHQRRVPRARHLVLALHRRAEGRRGRGRPQDPRRPRGARPGRVRRARHHRTRGARRRLSAGAPVALGPRHVQVKRLRSLVRDPTARATEQVAVLEGPRVIEGALDRGVTLDRDLSVGSDRAFAALHDRLRSAGVAVRDAEGRCAREDRLHGHAPAGARRRARDHRDVRRAAGVRSCARRGRIRRPRQPRHAPAQRRGFGSRRSRVLRQLGRRATIPRWCVPRPARCSELASLEEDDPVQMLETLGAAGRRRLGAVARGGTAPETLDLAGAGRVRARQRGPRPRRARARPRRRAHHDPDGRRGRVAQRRDGGHVLCFEAARQRRSAGGR